MLLGVVAALAVGAIVGWVMGVIVAFVGAHPILVSLALLASAALVTFTRYRLPSAVSRQKFWSRSLTSGRKSPPYPNCRPTASATASMLNEGGTAAMPASALMTPMFTNGRLAVNRRYVRAQCPKCRLGRVLLNIIGQKCPYPWTHC